MDNFNFNLECMSNRYMDIYVEAMASTVPVKSTSNKQPSWITPESAFDTRHRQPRLGLPIQHAMEVGLLEQYNLQRGADVFSETSVADENRRTFEILHQEQQVRSRATDEVTLSIQNDVVERNLKLTSLACETAELQRRHTNPNPFLAARESAAEA